MPLKPGNSKAVIRENFEEFGKGKKYNKTKGKYGKERADKQRIAVVLQTAHKRKG